MAQEIKDNGTEPVLAIAVTKVMWLMVLVIIYLAYVVLGFSDHVEKIVVGRAEKLLEIVDKELDDTNDAFEHSLEVILQGRCAEALSEFKAKHLCQKR